MAEHTPTPWRVFKTTDGRKLVGVGAQDGQGILDAGYGVWAWDDAEGIANAELVVKAVNNHEALVAALRGLDTLLDFGDDDLPNTWTFDDLSAIKAAFEAARLVLADVGHVQVSGGEK
jgi:hypothetical protein